MTDVPHPTIRDALEVAADAMRAMEGGDVPDWATRLGEALDEAETPRRWTRQRRRLRTAPWRKAMSDPLRQTTAHDASERDPLAAHDGLPFDERTRRERAVCAFIAAEKGTSPRLVSVAAVRRFIAHNPSYFPLLAALGAADAC